jgi:hypothetical protein
VADEFQLQVRQRSDGTSLALSSARTSLVARGRQEAALLRLQVKAESEVGRSGWFPGWVIWDFGPAERVREEADQGYAPAQFHLGWMYDDPYLGVPGVGQDYVEAAKWYRRAAEQGLAPAQFNLGVMYDMGEGVEQDYVEAAKWYRKAAEQGLAEAAFNLGIKYEIGEGVGQDSTEAAAWYRKSANQGFDRAQFNLGLKYANGQGVPQDYVQAHMWIALAAPRANRAHEKRYAATGDKIAAKMDSAQIAEAWRLAREWETNRREESIAKEPNLTGRCNKCGEDEALVFAGCVCAKCSNAFDRQWAGCAATDWLVTRPGDPEGRVTDNVLSDTTYAQMKKYSWAANDSESRIQGFFRYREATDEEIVQLKSQSGMWHGKSGARVVRPATSEEVAAKRQDDREWHIAWETDHIISEVSKEFGIQMNEQNEPFGDPQQIKQAVDEISGRLRQLGWLKELARMKLDEDCLAFESIDGVRLLEIVLQR